MSLLGRAARQVLSELLLLDCDDLDVIVHFHGGLLKQLVIVIVVLGIIIDRQPLLTAGKTLSLVIRFQMVLICGGRVVITWHVDPLQLLGRTRLLLVVVFILIVIR